MGSSGNTASRLRKILASGRLSGKEAAAIRIRCDVDKGLGREPTFSETELRAATLAITDEQERGVVNRWLRAYRLVQETARELRALYLQLSLQLRIQRDVIIRRLEHHHLGSALGGLIVDDDPAEVGWPNVGVKLLMREDGGESFSGPVPEGWKRLSDIVAGELTRSWGGPCVSDREVREYHAAIIWTAKRYKAAQCIVDSFSQEVGFDVAPWTGGGRKRLSDGLEAYSFLLRQCLKVYDAVRRPGPGIQIDPKMMRSWLGIQLQPITAGQIEPAADEVERLRQSMRSGTFSRESAEAFVSRSDQRGKRGGP